jgi:adenylate cyclase
VNRLRQLVGSERPVGVHIPAWIERLVSIGIVTSDAKLARRQRFTNVAAYAAAANAGSHLLINAYYDLAGLVPIHFYNASIVISALLIPRLHRHGENVAAMALVSLLTAGNLFVVWMFGLQSMLQVYFTLAGAMLFMYGVENWRVFAVWFVVVAAAMLVALHFAPDGGLVALHDRRLREVLSTHAMINMIVLNAVIIFYALSALQRTEVELEKENSRAEALLGALLPGRIANRLKAGAGRVADRVEGVTVLFADLAGFTPAAHGLTPDQVVGYLDELVSRLDALVDAHGVEKIKTIGDSYMAAAGLDGETKRGAVAAGSLALAMQELQSRTPPLGDRRLQLRIGIHTGPVTAGVIGLTRFSYDLWGDAVNVASRMESHGVPGRIQVSEEYRAAASDAFEFEERGPTEIKGLGNTRTFFLLGRRPERAA